MIRPQPPTESGSRSSARNPGAQALLEGLLARLAKLVTERFERISGLTVLIVPIGLPGAAEDESEPSQPGHPACVEFAGTAYCQESWRAHVAKLKHQPEVNWHHCDFGKLCAVIPLVWKRRCLVACKLVCPDSMKADAFEIHVELLDVLIENFVLTTFRTTCPADLSGDGIVEAFDLALLLGAWGPCPSPCTPGDPDQTCPPDLTGDCIVEAFDLATLLGSWGPCCGDGLCRPEEQCGLEYECEADCGPCP